MPFGKHRGEDLDDVPDDYLCWVLENLDDLRPTLREAIEDRLGVRRHRPPTPPAPDPSLVVETVARAVKSTYFAMAAQFHPDHRGGSVEAMIAINAMNEHLNRTLAESLHQLTLSRS